MKKALTQYVVFRIGKEYYGIDTDYTLRIVNDKNVRHLPGTKEEVKGIITLDDYTVTILDLREVFNIKSDSAVAIPYIMICEIKEENLAVGFVVDEVTEIKAIEANINFGNISEVISGDATDYIKGIYRPSKDKKDSEEEESGVSGKRNVVDEELLIILDIHKLIKANGGKEHVQPTKE